MSDTAAATSEITELKVLIADDAFDSRQWLVRLLRQFVRAQISEVRDGREAAEAFRLQAPDIVFLDIDMPEINGLEVLKDIRQTGQPTFVVIVSGTSAAGKVQEAVSLGVNGYVVKPYSAQRILDVLGRYAAQARKPVLLKPL